MDTEAALPSGLHTARFLGEASQVLHPNHRGLGRQAFPGPKQQCPRCHQPSAYRIDADNDDLLFFAEWKCLNLNCTHRWTQLCIHAEVISGSEDGARYRRRLTDLTVMMRALSPFKPVIPSPSSRVPDAFAIPAVVQGQLHRPPPYSTDRPVPNMTPMPNTDVPLQPFWTEQSHVPILGRRELQGQATNGVPVNDHQNQDTRSTLFLSPQGPMPGVPRERNPNATDVIEDIGPSALGYPATGTYRSGASGKLNAKFPIETEPIDQGLLDANLKGKKRRMDNENYRGVRRNGGACPDCKVAKKKCEHWQGQLSTLVAAQVQAQGSMAANQGYVAEDPGPSSSADTVVPNQTILALSADHSQDAEHPGAFHSPHRLSEDFCEPTSGLAMTAPLFQPDDDGGLYHDLADPSDSSFGNHAHRGGFESTEAFPSNSAHVAVDNSHNNAFKRGIFGDSHGSLAGGPPKAIENSASGASTDRNVDGTNHGVAGRLSMSGPYNMFDETAIDPQVTSLMKPVSAALHRDIDFSP